MVFFAAFLCVVALQVLILNIFDSAALAALSNIIAGMIVYSYYRLAGIDILISEIMPIMKIMIVLGLISAILYTFSLIYSQSMNLQIAMATGVKLVTSHFSFTVAS